MRISQFRHRNGGNAESITDAKAVDTPVAPMVVTIDGGSEYRRSVASKGGVAKVLDALRA